MAHGLGQHETVSALLLENQAYIPLQDQTISTQVLQSRGTETGSDQGVFMHAGRDRTIKSKSARPGF